MIVKLISPKTPTESFWNLETTPRMFLRKSPGFNLWLALLASLTPKDVKVIITDESIEKINFKEKVDLVGLSAMTCNVKRAFEIAQIYRKKGIKTILGGVHATLRPEECLKHCDSVVIGEAEEIWPQVIDDFRHNRLEKIYKADRFPDLRISPIPRYDLVKSDRYLGITVQTTRGCPFDCDFCSVKIINGPRYRMKEIRQIIDEIKSIKKIIRFQFIFICDDNIAGNPLFTKELIGTLRSSKIRWWICQASMDLGDKDDILPLMKKSGCIFVFVGIESIKQENLKEMNKKINKVEQYKNQISNIHSNGMLVWGSLILGNDFDDINTFRETYEFLQQNNILICMINILTPFPGTRLFKRIEDENRFLTRDWNLYDGNQPIIKFKNLTQEEFINGFNWLYKKYYDYDNIYERIRGLIKKGDWKQIKDRISLYEIFVVLNVLRGYLITKDVKQIRFFLKVISLVLSSKNIDIYFLISVLIFAKGLHDFAQNLPRVKNSELYEKTSTP